MKTLNNSMNRRLSNTSRAFTLIELLIVIGLTAVLFALLLVPLVSAINYTRQAQIVTAAQDAARITRERLTRELGSAMYVFDGTSHPFLVPTGTTPTQSDDRYTNFLNLEIPTSNQVGGKYVNTIAHAYSAKLDFVLPRTNAGGAVVHDPTTTNTNNSNDGDPISYRQTDNGSAVVSDPSYVFPLAAGTTMIRYWIGLKDPTQPYNNTHEGKFSGNSDNTYILYRAQFQPYTSTNGGGAPTANTQLFETRAKLNPDGTTAVDAGGKPILLPELDDPDFFRDVSTADINWLNDSHSKYTSAEVNSHNTRVGIWRQIAKPVIPGPNVDLILLPHKADNTLAYDSGGVPHNGTAHDPVLNKDFPIVNPSVTFRAATVSGDGVPGTTTDYGSAGLPSVSGESGYTYVPTFYTATNRSWTLPFHVTLYPGNYSGTQNYFSTQIASSNDTGSPSLFGAGDLLEYEYAGDSDLTGKLVYNITRAYPIKSTAGTNTLGGTDFVPLSVYPDNGTINFGTPSLPKGATDRNSRNWDYNFDATADTDTNGGVDPNGSIQLWKQGQTATASSPLTDPSLLPASAPGVRDAHVIPGGIRVYGPDTTPGPNLGQIVPYTEVNATSDISGNQYHVNYAANTLQVSLDAVTAIQSAAGGSTRITVVYDYQANMTLTDPTKVFSADNPYLPMEVKVDYQTRDIIDVSIGVRIYDLVSNRAQVIPAQTKIKIGNSNR